jgi:hypothetical protein
MAATWKTATQARAFPANDLQESAGAPDATAAGRNAAGFNGTAYDAVGLDERRFRHAFGRFATGVVVISSGSDKSIRYVRLRTMQILQRRHA